MICKTILLINLTVFPWSGKDMQSMNHAINTCKVKYKGCLVKFKKTEEQAFHAICRKEQ